MKNADVCVVNAAKKCGEKLLVKGERKNERY